MGSSPVPSQLVAVGGVGTSRSTGGGGTAACFAPRGGAGGTTVAAGSGGGCWASSASSRTWRCRIFGRPHTLGSAEWRPLMGPSRVDFQAFACDGAILPWQEFPASSWSFTDSARTGGGGGVSSVFSNTCR